MCWFDACVTASCGLSLRFRTNSDVIVVCFAVFLSFCRRLLDFFLPLFSVFLYVGNKLKEISKKVNRVGHPDESCNVRLVK